MKRNEIVSKLAKVFHDNAIDCGKTCEGCWCGDKHISDKLIPNFNFNIDDVIVNKENGRKFVVIDIIYSFKDNDYYYRIDDRELSVDFNMKCKIAEYFCEKENENA